MQEKLAADYSQPSHRMKANHLNLLRYLHKRTGCDQIGQIVDASPLSAAANPASLIAYPPAASRHDMPAN